MTEILSPALATYSKLTSPTASEPNTPFSFDLPLLDSDFSLIHAPNSPEPSSSIPLYNNIHELVISSTNTDISMSMLSLIPNSASIKTSDYYLHVNDQMIIYLSIITDNEAPSITPDGTPFIMQAILYGPGAKTLCFQANMNDGAMVNILDLRAFIKALQNLENKSSGW